MGDKGGQSDRHPLTKYKTICKHYYISLPGEANPLAVKYFTEAHHDRVGIYTQVYKTLSFMLLSHHHDGHIDSNYEVDKVCLCLFNLF